jgi:hypothetical protein
MEDVGIFYCHLVHCTAIWYILWPFGIIYGRLVYFVAIWVYFMGFLKRFPGVGSEPGSSWFHLFSHFSPLNCWATAAPRVYFMVIWFMFYCFGILYIPIKIWQHWLCEVPTFVVNIICPRIRSRVDCVRVTQSEFVFISVAALKKIGDTEPANNA